MTHVTPHPLAVTDEPRFVVHVEDKVSATLAGHEGVEYHSPPLPRDEALALARVLLGDDRPAAERRSWRCPIAGGQRTITIEPLSDLQRPSRGGQFCRTR